MMSDVHCITFLVYGPLPKVFHPTLHIQLLSKYTVDHLAQQHENKNSKTMKK
jgi:hypothetical protein